MTPSDGNTRKLVFPNGGTMDIPLPGSKARFAMRPGGMLADSESCPARLTLIVGIVLGVAVGVGATAWYLRSR
jgi:hypothetical protein